MYRGEQRAIVWSTFVPNKDRAVVTKKKKRLLYTATCARRRARANVCNIIILARHIAPGLVDVKLDEIIDVEYIVIHFPVPYAPPYRATIMHCTKMFR